MNLFRMGEAELDALVGDNLRRLRQEAGLSASAAAKLLGMDPERLANAERGAAHLSARELSDATRAFRCSFAALFAAPAPARIAS